MAATNKSELLSISEKEYLKLSKLIASIDEHTAITKLDEDTSIKDVIAHRAHWIELFLGWYRDGQAGKTVYFPAEGYKWSELKRFNANLRAKQSVLSWADSVSLLQSNYQRLISFINGHSEADLYGGPMKGAHNAWTPGRWAEAAGPSHFRSAAKFVRAEMKRLK